MTPVVLLTVAFAAGSLIFLLGLRLSALAVFVSLAVLFLIVVILYWRGKKNVPLFLMFFFVILGYSWALFSEQRFPQSLQSLYSQQVVVKGRVSSLPVVYNNRYVFDLENIAVSSGSCCRQDKTKVRVTCYFKEKGENQVPVLLPGDLVDVQGSLEKPPGALNPGSFDYAKYLRYRGIFALLKTSSSPELQAAGDKGYSCRRYFSSLRLRFKEEIKKALPNEEGVFLEALLLGVKEGFTPEDQEIYQKTGILHLFSISGLHVGFILALFLSFARLLRLGRTASFLVVSLGILSYAALVGFPYSVVRALVMGIAATAAYLWRWPRSSVNALALAALVILLIDPFALADPGFQLSFCAAGGILFLTRPLACRLPLPGGWREALALPLAAQLAVLPISARCFQVVSLLGLLANVLIVPIVGVLVNLGFMGMLLSLCCQGYGEPFFLMSGFCCLLIKKFLIFLSGIPGCALWTTSPSWWLAILWFVMLFLLGLSCRGKVVSFCHFTYRDPVRRLFLPSFLGLALVFCLIVIGIPLGPKLLRVSFLSVGQGDAILVEMPCGSKMLIDGGGSPEYSLSSFDPGREIVVPYLYRQGIRELDLVVNSHPDEDHLGGLLAVIEEVKVKAFAACPEKEDPPLWQEMKEKLRENHVPLYYLSQGDALNLDPESKLQVLHPPPDLLVGTGNDENNNSLVLLLSYGDISFLFTGDLQTEGINSLTEHVEKELLADVVLKAPHHGSKSGFSPAFANLVQPHYVVISVGPNPFGHPALETLSFWRERGAKILRTDVEGAIVFETDGKRLFLRTAVDPEKQ